MIDIDYLKQLLLIAITLSTITCAFVQKTKSLFKSSRYIMIYSAVINIIISIFFCITFTKIKFPNSIWIGLFSFIGADSIFKTLEGKIASHTELTSNNKKTIKEENIINKEDEK